MLQTIQIILKNASNKSCSELNFPQKTQWMHILIFPRSGVRGPQRFPFLISYYVLKLKNYHNHDNSGLLILTNSFFNSTMIFFED